MPAFIRAFFLIATCVFVAAADASAQAIVEPFAGPVNGPGFRDAIGTEARFFSPTGIASDGRYVYVADGRNGMVRRMDIATGEVTTLVGGPGPERVLEESRDLWGDAAGLYVMDRDGTMHTVDLETGALSPFPGIPPPRGICSRCFYGAQAIAAGNATHLYVIYQQFRGGDPRFLGWWVRQVSRDTSEGVSLPGGFEGSGLLGDLWADDRFLYYVFESGWLGRLDLSGDTIEPLFHFPEITAPRNLWGDGAGRLFFSDGSNVYRVELATGRLDIVGVVPESASGTRVGGLTGAGGRLFGTDTRAHTVFEVDITAKRATTVAGTASASASAVWPQTSTLFGVADIWSDGNQVYAVDEDAHAILKIHPGKGEITTFASIEYPTAIWGDGSHLYVTQETDVVTKVSLATGAQSVLAGGFVWLRAVTGDANSLYVADLNKIQRVSKTTGEVSIVAGDDAQGFLDGIGTEARFSTLAGLWIDGSELYVAENYAIRKVDLVTREVTTLAGASSRTGFQDGIGPDAGFDGVRGLAGDADYLYAAEQTTVRRISRATAEVTTIAGVFREYGHRDGVADAARFGTGNQHIESILADGSILYVVDGRLRRLDPQTQAVTTVAGKNIVRSEGVFPSDEFGARSLTGHGDFIYAVNGYAVYRISKTTREITPLAGAFNESDSIDARGSAARFENPTVLWSDGRYVYVQDASAGLDWALRKIDVETGEVTTFVAESFYPAAWGDGRFLYTARHTEILRIDLATAASTVVATYESWVRGMWGDGEYLYITEAYPSCGVRKLNLQSGETALLAGSSLECDHRDAPGPVDGVGGNAAFGDPQGITGDGSLIYVVDGLAVRSVDPRTDGLTVRSVDPRTGETRTIAGQHGIVGNDGGVGPEAHFLTSTRSLLRGDRSNIWSDGTDVYVSDGLVSSFRGDLVHRATGTIRRLRIPVRPVSRVEFDVAAAGGDYWKTASMNDPLRIAYGRLQAGEGRVSPGAVAIFSYRPNGVLVSEVSVPATPPVQEGRIHVEVDGYVNTGLAIANANPEPATVSFYFTDASGVNFGAGTHVIAPDGQIAAFLSEAPFRPSDRPVAEARSFTFSSSLPVGVVALRGFTNERSDFLMTALPVGPLGSAYPGTILLPHFAAGGGWRTQVLLVNPTDREIRGTVEAESSVGYAIPPRSAARIEIPDTGTTVRTGVVRVVPSLFQPSPSVSTVFSFRQSGVVVGESGVAPAPTSPSFRLFAEAGAVRTGVAVANAVRWAGVLSFTLLDFEGATVAVSDPVNLGGRAHMSMFLDEIPGFDELPADFRGVVEVEGTVPISAVGLRGQYNARGDFLISATPALSEAAPPGTAEAIFPHIVAGAGYTTELLLLSREGSGAGAVGFISQDGESVWLPIGR